MIIINNTLVTLGIIYKSKLTDEECKKISPLLTKVVMKHERYCFKRLEVSNYEDLTNLLYTLNLIAKAPIIKTEQLQKFIEDFDMTKITRGLTNLLKYVIPNLNDVTTIFKTTDMTPIEELISAANHNSKFLATKLIVEWCIKYNIGMSNVLNQGLLTFLRKFIKDDLVNTINIDKITSVPYSISKLIMYLNTVNYVSTNGIKINKSDLEYLDLNLLEYHSKVNPYLLEHGLQNILESRLGRLNYIGNSMYLFKDDCIRTYTQLKYISLENWIKLYKSNSTHSSPHNFTTINNESATEYIKQNIFPNKINTTEYHKNSTIYLLEIAQYCNDLQNFSNLIGIYYAELLGKLNEQERKTVSKSLPILINDYKGSNSVNKLIILLNFLLLNRTKNLQFSVEENIQKLIYLKNTGVPLDSIIAKVKSTTDFYNSDNLRRNLDIFYLLGRISSPYPYPYY